MVVLPKTSRFMMGSGKSALDENETPRHRVRLKSFAISRHEVTFEEYLKFVKATGRAEPDDKEWGKSKRPVMNVSWNDAVAYAKWLSQATGHIYRLPTEAEWEYAARAGTYTDYYWGKIMLRKRANCFDCGSSWDSNKTAPVARFKANQFGLYDMLGNVMEWTQDCFHPNYKGAPGDGSAWVTGSCKTRVARGGSYKSSPDSIRVFTREHHAPGTRSPQIGFRLVREM
jgi:formylglycine-generating enzyme required for sulfatase activity